MMLRDNQTIKTFAADSELMSSLTILQSTGLLTKIDFARLNSMIYLSDAPIFARNETHLRILKFLCSNLNNPEIKAKAFEETVIALYRVLQRDDANFIKLTNADIDNIWSVANQTDLKARQKSALMILELIANCNPQMTMLVEKKGLTR